MKKIVVTGIGDTRNNGCWAMAASAMTSIRQESPVPVKFIILNRKVAVDTERLAFDDVEFVPQPWSLVTVRRLRLLWILLSAMLLLLQASLHRLMPHKLFFRRYWKAMSEADLVLDLSGDSISSDYNWVANLTVILPLLVSGLITKPYYLCAQSIGPFGKGLMGRLTIQVLKMANLITVREGRTTDILAGLGIVNNVKRTEDLAFLLTPSDGVELQRLLDQESIDRSTNWIGVSVSSIIARYAFRDLPPAEREEAYLSALAAFCDDLYSRYGFCTLFIPHVVIPEHSDDRGVTINVQQRMRYKETSHIINGDYTGAQLKAFIGLCRFFVGSRMHATIAALSQGIPTVTLVYNHKTLGINGDVLNQHDYLIDIRRIGSDDFGAALNGCFSRLFTNAASVRASLQAVLPKVREGSRQNACLAIDFLETAGPLQQMTDVTHCTGCGTCVGACPTNTLAMRETPQGTLRPGSRRRCSGCRRCDRVCPVLGLDLTAAVKDKFGASVSDADLGVCISCQTGHATDSQIRYDGASGGMVTAVAGYLLESGRVDAVLVVGADVDNPFSQQTSWATTLEELRSAQGSRYLPASVNAAFQQIPSGAQRLAVVGLPCHLWGVHLLEKTGALAGRSIDWKFGLFCGRTPSLLAADALLAGLGATRRETTTLTFRGEGWPGTSQISTSVKETRMPLSQMWGFVGSPFFAPAHCFSCPDFFAALSDLSFGDAWLPECRGDRLGTSLVLARSERAAELLDEMRREGRLETNEVAAEKVRNAFLGNIRRKQSYSRIKSAITGTPFPVVCGPPQGGSSRIAASFRFEWLLGRMGQHRLLREKFLTFPPGKTMKALRKIANYLQKAR